MSLDFSILTRRRNKPGQPSNLFNPAKKEDGVSPPDSAADFGEQKSPDNSSEFSGIDEAVFNDIQKTAGVNHSYPSDEPDEPDEPDDFPVIEHGYLSDEPDESPVIEHGYPSDEPFEESKTIPSGESIEDLMASMERQLADSDENLSSPTHDETDAVPDAAPVCTVKPWFQPKDIYFEVASESLVLGVSASIERLTMEVLNAHQITNLSLAAFGEMSQMYSPVHLQVIPFGHHRFIGCPLSHLDKHRMYYAINEIIAKTDKKQISFKLTQTVQFNSMTYRTLVATEDELREYSSLFGRSVLVDLDETDEAELMAVIKCD